MTAPSLRLCFLATLGLALVATANSEAIYRCGNSYSQTPCAEAQVLQIDDSRDVNRKKEADAATRRDTKLAKELQRDRLERLQQEQASFPKQSRHNKPEKPRAAPIKAPKDQIVLIKPTRLKSTLYKPKGFTALVPGSEKKSGATKHAVKAKPAASK